MSKNFYMLSSVGRFMIQNISQIYPFPSFSCFYSKAPLKFCQSKKICGRLSFLHFTFFAWIQYIKTILKSLILQVDKEIQRLSQYIFLTQITFQGKRSTFPSYWDSSLYVKVNNQYNSVQPSRFLSDQYHRIHRTGMEQLQQSSHPQTTHLLPFTDVHVMQLWH